MICSELFIHLIKIKSNCCQIYPPKIGMIGLILSDLYTSYQRLHKHWVNKHQMHMDENLIDAILNDIQKQPNYELEQSDIVRNGATQIQYREIINYLCQYDFIRQPFPKHGKLTILEKGNEVLKLGGWEKYQMKEQEIKGRIAQKAIHDAQISKFQATYGKYALPISAIALLVAIGSLIVAILMYQSRRKEIEKQDESKHKIEKIQPTDIQMKKKLK